jgi:hypothetical protein
LPQLLNLSGEKIQPWVRTRKQFGGLVLGVSPDVRLVFYSHNADTVAKNCGMNKIRGSRAGIAMRDSTV